VSSRMLFNKTGSSPYGVSVGVKATLNRVAQASCDLVRSQVLEELRGRVSRFVSVGGPYGDPATLLERLGVALVVRGLPEGGFRVGFDTQLLAQIGIPERLLVDLEYGSPTGTPPLGFWRIGVGKAVGRLSGVPRRILSR